MPKQTNNLSQTDIDNFKRAMNQFSEALGTPYWLVSAHAQHREWSDATFGPREEKGPIGPLKHLKKECDEAIADPSDILEFADLQFLLWDAAHRAGHSLPDLARACHAKLTVLKTRTYPKVADGEPSFHVKDGGE